MHASYDEGSFWAKVKRVGRSVGGSVLTPAFELYAVARSDATPPWAKALAFASLAYFISPIDAIPDVLGPAGYVDDVGVMAGALASLRAYVGQELRRQALAEVRRLLG